MRGLSSLAWRSLAARRLRSLLTILGIALGVGVLLAALATDAGIDASIGRTVADLVGRADLRIEAFEERGLSPATVELVRETPGVKVVAPTLEQRTFLQVRGTDLGLPVTVEGIDPATERSLRDLALLAGVDLAPDTQASILVTETLAHERGLGLGSTVMLYGAAEPGPATVRVIGIVAGDGPVPGAFGRTAWITLDAAQRLFASEAVSRIDVGLSREASLQTVIGELERRLSLEPYVLREPKDIAASLQASTTDFRMTLALLAAVALFVGAFLIFNTLSMTVVERIGEVGLLRAAGATRRQVNGLFLVQGLILGIAGSLLGILAGYGLAALMAGWVRSIEAVPIDRLVLPVGGVALAAAVGIVVTLAAALEPAWRAGRIAPVEALRGRHDAGPLLRARLRWLAIVALAVAVPGILLWPGEGSGGTTLARPFLVYGLLLLAALATPFVLRPLGPVAGLLFAPFFRTEERLTRGSLLRDRSRTALTVGALTVGLAMIVAVGAVAQNARQSVSAWLVRVVPGDEVLTSIRPVGLDEGVGELIGGIDGVVRVTPVATFQVAVSGARLDAAAVVGADLLADGRLDVIEGDRASALHDLDAGGSVIVPRSEAERLGLQVGDALPFTTGAPATTLRVAAVVEHGFPGPNGETFLVGWPDATERFGVLGADFFAVRYAAGRATDAAATVDAAARGLALEPTTLAAIEGEVEAALGRLFGLFDALALVAILIAGLGIVNTLTMNVLERVRELGILRAVGMTQVQVWRMVVVEAGILGAVGALAGCTAGVVVGVVMMALTGGGVGVLSVPWATIALAAIFGIAVSMLAAAYPARVASRLTIVRALQAE